MSGDAPITGAITKASMAIVATRCHALNIPRRLERLCAADHRLHWRFKIVSERADVVMPGEHVGQGQLRTLQRRIREWRSRDGTKIGVFGL